MERRLRRPVFRPGKSFAQHRTGNPARARHIAGRGGVSRLFPNLSYDVPSDRAEIFSTAFSPIKQQFTRDRTGRTLTVGHQECVSSHSQNKRGWRSCSNSADCELPLGSLSAHRQRHSVASDVHQFYEFKPWRGGVQLPNCVRESGSPDAARRPEQRRPPAGQGHVYCRTM